MDQNTNTGKTSRICLFGGTFNPIHLGHTYIAQAARKYVELDQVIFLPCQTSPHKQGQQATNGATREKLCQLAIRDLQWASVHDHDLTSSPPNYSWRTAEYFKNKFSDTELFWLMGTDQWNALHRWDQPDRLAAAVTFIVFSRGDEPLVDRSYNHKVIHGNHPASSTAIRKSFSEQATPHLAWLHPSVIEHIERLSENTGPPY